ncbi:MAG TPA: ATP-binding cassette domain-containing protein [Acidimicrobiales bacterium]|nr:ATP-binding cassette domain-containing protein [Acidimicrobiales bacterium]
MIRFDSVTKQYPDGTKAVDGLSIEMSTGQITVLVGSSGSGKTTTLRMINRMIEPSSGTITIDDRNIMRLRPYELRRGIGYVIQQGGLFPHRKVIDNVTTVPNLLGWDKKKARQRGLEMLELVGLPNNFADRYPGQLSGGQQQRVGVARALAADPPVLLMDEPFGAVDPIVRAQLQQEFLNLQNDLHKTVVFVTHDVDEAVLLGDRIAVLTVGARVEQFAPPAELLARPANTFVADFLGNDRGLKLLSLVPASDVGLDDVSELVNGWRLVTDPQHRPVGWANGDGAPPIPVVGVGPHGTARSLLDAAVSAPSGHAVRVDDDGRVVGVVSYDAIGKLLTDKLKEASA